MAVTCLYFGTLILNKHPLFLFWRLHAYLILWHVRSLWGCPSRLNCLLCFVTFYFLDVLVVRTSKSIELLILHRYVLFSRCFSAKSGKSIFGCWSTEQQTVLKGRDVRHCDRTPHKETLLYLSVSIFSTKYLLRTPFLSSHGRRNDVYLYVVRIVAKIPSC